jgi:hypothetical protein
VEVGDGSGLLLLGLCLACAFLSFKTEALGFSSMSVFLPSDGLGSEAFSLGRVALTALGIGGAQAHELGAFIIGEGHVVDSGDLQARKEKRQRKTAALVGLAEAEGSKIEPARRYHESQ